jgi:hypothetical protein
MVGQGRDRQDREGVIVFVKRDRCLEKDFYSTLQWLKSLTEFRSEFRENLRPIRRPECLRGMIKIHYRDCLATCVKFDIFGKTFRHHVFEI